MTKEDLLQRLMFLPVSILSLSVHEWAHAWSAFRLGDDTASRQGRLTLNPLAHIDPLGTILLPVLGFPIGWAKPVPVNPLRFRREVMMKTGMMITAVAGPLSNLVLAILSAIGLGLLKRYRIEHVAEYGLYMFLKVGLLMNVGLCLFNLLPIPPLDGSRVADFFMPYRLRPQWEQLSRYGFIILGAVMIFGLGGTLLFKPIRGVTRQLDRITDVVAGR
jgi:Zn-dependent protease